VKRAAPPTERRFETGATLALTGLTAAVALGLGRLFVDSSFLGPVLAATVVTHFCAWVTRRMGWSAVPAIATSLAVGAVTIVLIRYGAQSSAGLPNRTVLDALGADLQESWRIFQDQGAPAPVADGFVVGAMAAVVAIAVTADALAFRVGAPLEAIAPAGSLFLFTTVLSGPDHRITATLLFVAAALAFVLAHRVARHAGAEGWLAAPRARGAVALLRAGAGLAAIGLVGGVLIGPVLPGADADPIIDLGGDGGDDRVTISPLVEIQSRLVDQSDVEVFTVRSSERAYWRMTALDQFDGTVWSAGGEYVGAAGPLPRPTGGEAPGRREIRQEIRIGALADIWLPAAYQPRNVEADVGVEWNAASSSLVVDPDRDSSDDVSYEVVSSAPVIDSAIAAATEPAGAALDPLRRLPQNFSLSAARVAAEAAAGATTPYEQALALQNFFRSGFEYSLDVPAGHGVADIDEFLEARIGYCEQFSGAYAALARSLGLPARVAVGFTPGTADPDDPGLFHVRGEHAHAWPEVYLEGLGWVAFEPTPGRGAPGAEAYTGVAEQQQGEQAPGVPAPTTTTPATPPPSVDGIAPAAPATSSPSFAGSEGRAGDRNWRATTVLVLAFLGAAWLLGLPALISWRRFRDRRQAAGRPANEVAAAWSEAVDSLDRVGLHRRAAETPMAFAARVQATLAPAQHGAMTDLAGAVTALWFGGPGQVDAPMATSSHQATEVIEEGARERAGLRQWWLSGLDPRRLIRQRRTHTGS
jgi:transglutaminase-like putative cysteine protease